MSDDRKAIIDSFLDWDARHDYNESNIRQLVPLQIRLMREERGWSQTELGEQAGGIKQGPISNLESPSSANVTLKTLQRLARAFDVALVVRFVSFGELVDWVTSLGDKQLSPPGFTVDDGLLEKAPTTAFSTQDFTVDAAGNVTAAWFAGVLAAGWLAAGSTASVIEVGVGPREQQIQRREQEKVALYETA